MTAGLWLYAVCRPWIVALPALSVQRVAPLDDLGGLEVTPLSRLLGLAPSPIGAAAIVAGPQGPRALGVERCLQVALLSPGGLTIPAAALRQRRLAACFPVTLAAVPEGLAPFGLVLDASAWTSA